MVVSQSLALLQGIEALLAVDGGAVNQKTIAILIGNPMNAEKAARLMKGNSMNSMIKSAGQKDGAHAEPKANRTFDKGVTNQQRNIEHDRDADGPRFEIVMLPPQHQDQCKNRQQHRQDQVP